MLIPSLISRVLFLQRSWQNGSGHCRSVATTAFWHQRTQYDGFAPNKLSGDRPWQWLARRRMERGGGRWEWLIASRNRSIATVLLHQSGKSIAAAAAAEIFLSAAESKSMCGVDLYSLRFKIYKETHPLFFFYDVLCWEPLFCWYYWFSQSKKFPQFKMSYYTLNSNIWHLVNISGRHSVVQRHLFCFPAVWVCHLDFWIDKIRQFLLCEEQKLPAVRKKKDCHTNFLIFFKMWRSVWSFNCCDLIYVLFCFLKKFPHYDK